MTGGAARQDLSTDALIVVPGVMGSALEHGDGRPLWGFRRLRTYAEMWRADASPLDELAVTDDERQGRYGRVRATGLITGPAWAAFIGGLAPYADLISAIRAVVVHPDAVTGFAYDWRLPVEHNARELARAAAAHHRRWSAHQALADHRREFVDARPPGVALVAHSMGGLLCRALPLVADEELDIRATVTLGTPFDGAAAAVRILNRGEGAPLPLPRTRLQALAATFPGLHDLLPHYRCLDQDNDEPRRLSPTDVADIGGDRALSQAAFDFHGRTASLSLPHHRAVIGVAQPTIQTMKLHAGRVTGANHTFRPLADGGFERDRHGRLVHVHSAAGDGTVPYNSARPLGPHWTSVAQQHGALARSPSAITMVTSWINGGEDEAPRLGEGDLGLTVPTIVTAGTEWAAAIDGINATNDVICTVSEQEAGLLDRPPVHRRDGQWQATIVLPRPGIYRISIGRRGADSVDQYVLAGGLILPR